MENEYKGSLHIVSRQMCGWMYGRIDAQPEQWMSGWMQNQTNGWVDGCTVEPMDGWMDGQLDQWMSGWLHKQIQTNVWLDGWTAGPIMSRNGLTWAIFVSNFSVYQRKIFVRRSMEILKQQVISVNQ